MNKQQLHSMMDLTCILSFVGGYTARSEGLEVGNVELNIVKSISKLQRIGESLYKMYIFRDNNSIAQCESIKCYERVVILQRKAHSLCSELGLTLDIDTSGGNKLPLLLTVPYNNLQVRLG